MKELKEIAKSFAKHKAVNNGFYDLWLSKRLSFEELQIFARNYGEWVKSFPDTLAMLFSSTDNAEAKIEFVKTLYSEMGYGDEEKVHWKLLDNFLSELALKMGKKGKLERDFLKKNFDVLPTTIDLIDGERELYTTENKARSVGAQMALEWQAYTMLRLGYEGARNYKDLWVNEDEFHEACEYFYVHIGAAEKEHKKESIKGAEQYAIDKKNLHDIADGYNQHLELIANFWDGIYNELEKLNHKK